MDYKGRGLCLGRAARLGTGSLSAQQRGNERCHRYSDGSGAGRSAGVRSILRCLGRRPSHPDGLKPREKAVRSGEEPLPASGFLDVLAERPWMFLRRKSVGCLRAFLDGYCLAAEEEGYRDCRDFGWFRAVGETAAPGRGNFSLGGCYPGRLCRRRGRSVPGGAPGAEGLPHEQGSSQ